VPANPAGVNGSPRLAPQSTPSSALVCAYQGSNLYKQQAGWALSGQRPLTSGLASLAAELSWQPRRVPGQPVPCTGVGGPQTNYLIGLTYAGGGRIWVTATDEPNECFGSSNGEFTSPGDLGPEITTAFASGRWPADQPASCSGSTQSVGRLGDDAVMVPAGSTSLTICAPSEHMFSSGYQTLVSALNRLPTKPSTLSCSPSPPPSAPQYSLLFSYPGGPPVAVMITSDCYPEVDNLSLESYSASTIMPLIQQLLKTA
jgi:hypothetical protein